MMHTATGGGRAVLCAIVGFQRNPTFTYSGAALFVCDASPERTCYVTGCLLVLRLLSLLCFKNVSAKGHVSDDLQKGVWLSGWHHKDEAVIELVTNRSTHQIDQGCSESDTVGMSPSVASC